MDIFSFKTYKRKNMNQLTKIHLTSNPSAAGPSTFVS